MTKKLNIQEVTNSLPSIVANLPRDRATINAWCRAFFALDPNVSRIINQHAVIITKYFEIESCTVEANDDLIKNMFHRLDISNLLEKIIVEYFVLGEVFIYADLDNFSGVWNELIIQNPDYLLVKKDSINKTQYLLRPDENMRRIVLSDKPEDVKIREILDPSTVTNIKNGENIPINEFNLTHLVRKISPYEIRGTSFLHSLMRILQKTDRSSEDIIIIGEVLMDINCVQEKNNPFASNILYGRYCQIFEMLENWFNQKIIAPVSKIQKFEFFPKVKFNREQLQKDLLKCALVEK